MQSPLLLFPPIEWFVDIINHHSVTFQVHEHFIKQSYRNRFTIITANGLQHLTVHLARRSSKTLTKDIKLDYTENWPLLHLKTLKTAYNNSPYFFHYEPYFEKFYQNKPKFLLDFNLEALNICKKLLKTDFEITLSKEFITDDFYNKYGSPNYLKSSQSLPFPKYIQVFEDRHGFVDNLSILDLLFNLGPEANFYLKNCSTVNNI